MTTAAALIGALIVFNLGVVVGIGVHVWLQRKSTPAGVMKITRTDEKVIYSLELQEDPALLEYVGEVVFKVETSDKSSNRE